MAVGVVEVIYKLKYLIFLSIKNMGKAKSIRNFV